MQNTHEVAQAAAPESRIVYVDHDPMVPYIVRTPDEMRRFVDGLDLVEPGLVSISRWRPDPIEPGTPPAVDAYGGVARKP